MLCFHPAAVPLYGIFLIYFVKLDSLPTPPPNKLDRMIIDNMQDIRYSEYIGFNKAQLIPANVK